MLLDLPPEILLKIIKYTGTLYSLNRTCSYLRILCDDPALRISMDIPLSMISIPDVILSDDPQIGCIISTIDNHNQSIPFIIVGESKNFYDIIFPNMYIDGKYIIFGPCVIKVGCCIDRNAKRLLRNMTKYCRERMNISLRIEKMNLRKQPPDNLYRISRVYKQYVHDNMFLSERGRISNSIYLPDILINPGL